jgi:phospholipid/cholesterol/gamma-HCH transport system substrate-binding protein
MVFVPGSGTPGTPSPELRGRTKSERLPTSSVIGRIAAFLALIGAAVVLLLLVMGGGSSYTVTGQFENASQLVPGNTVNVAGVAAGSIKEITLADDGQAEVKMEVSEEYAPLPEGTHATVRSQSLSGIANRYVDLDLPPEPADGETISDGGVIAQVNTTSEVDLDQLFNALDEETVRSIKSVIKGFARSYDGVGPQANRGFYYLNPFLSTSRRVFGELNSDQPALESLIVDGASLTEALAERAPDLEALVGNLDQMMGAIGNQEESLASAIGQFPDFMRQFNTTAFNLRAALDDVDPLITASRPVARKLQPFTKRLRGFARDAVPTVRDLDSIVKAPGAANDLIELTELQVPLAEIGVGPVNRNGASRRGALPESVVALGTDCENCTGPSDDGGLTELRFFRPYLTSDAISGWFDDFGHSGFPDALGGVGRISTTFNAFTVDATPFGLPFPVVELGEMLAPDDIKGLLDLRNLERCPGANVHGSQLGSDGPLDYSDDPSFDGGLDCDPDQTLPGP